MINPFNSTKNIIIGVLLLIALVFAVFNFWQYLHDRAEQAKQDGRSASAQVQVAKDAMTTVLDRTDKNLTIDELVQKTQAEIANETDPTISGVAVRTAACQLPNYRNDPACRVYSTDTP